MLTLFRDTKFKSVVFFCRNTKPVLLTNLTVEKQASAVYTGTIFGIFQSNLKDSLLHGVRQDDTVSQ